MTYEVVDFRKPGRISEDISLMFSQWQEAAREAVEVRWGKCSLASTRISIATPAALSGTDLRALDESSVIYRIDVDDSNSPTLFVLRRTMALALVSEMLGMPANEEPEDRPLSLIETTCLDYLINEFRIAMESSQKLNPTRSLTQTGRVRLKELHREFPEPVTYTDVGFHIELPYGPQLLRWVLPQNVTLDMVASVASSKVRDSRQQQQLEDLIASSRARLQVQLGRCEVSLEKLANLKPGDVLVLNQRIDEPCPAVLGGRPVFLGWGARIGQQQAFQIDEVVEP